MQIIYERDRKTTEIEKTLEDGTKVAGTRNVKDVIILSAVEFTEEGKPDISLTTSRAGKTYLRVALTPTIVEDEDFGAVTVPNTVMFFDKASTKFGPSLDATKNYRKLKSVKEGEEILFKASKQTDEYEDGSGETVYFASNAVRSFMGQSVSYKTSDYGTGCTAIFGRAIESTVEGHKMISIPMQAWDSAAAKTETEKGATPEAVAEVARYTYWVDVKGVSPDDENLAYTQGDDGKMHPPVCVFVSKPLDVKFNEDETSKRRVNGSITPYTIAKVS